MVMVVVICMMALSGYSDCDKIVMVTTFDNLHQAPLFNF